MTSGAPDYFPRTITSGQSFEQVKVSVDDSDSTGTFSQQVKSMLIFNDGNSYVHFNKDAAATTDHFKIPAKSWLTCDIPITIVHLICPTGKTATCYVVGVY